MFEVDYLAKVKATRQKYAKLGELSKCSHNLENSTIGNIQNDCNCIVWFLEAEEKEKDEKYHRKSYLPPIEDYDDGGRPIMKVALLSGDPGLGKTTCAHIIARHAGLNSLKFCMYTQSYKWKEYFKDLFISFSFVGYNIREMNASDDRSIEIFRKTLDDTTQSRSEAFQKGRPNCLIIDEIDGSPLVCKSYTLNSIINFRYSMT